MPPAARHVAPPVPPPGYVTRAPDGSVWRWDGARWHDLALPPKARRGLDVATSALVAGILQLLAAPALLLGMADTMSMGDRAGVSGVLIVLCFGLPAVVLGIVGRRRATDPVARARALGGLVTGSAAFAVLLLTLLAMGV
jgi:hypothetical protein